MVSIIIIATILAQGLEGVNAMVRAAGAFRDPIMESGSESLFHPERSNKS
jgi:hypothetical protein